MPVRPKVLIVGNDVELLRLFEDTLVRMGLEPRALATSREAVELIQREKFDGVFLDLALEGVSALELAEQVRWSKSNSRCPIAMITDTPESSMLKKCFRAGVNFFLHKPVTVPQLEILLNATRGIMAHERRRYQRVRVQVPVLCEWEIQSVPQVVTGQSIDLSPSGMRLSLEVTPPPGGVIQTKFNLPGHPPPFSVTARIVRIGPKQEVSLTFTGLSQAMRHRLMDCIERTLSASSRSPLASATR